MVWARNYILHWNDFVQFSIEHLLLGAIFCVASTIKNIVNRLQNYVMQINEMDITKERVSYAKKMLPNDIYFYFSMNSNIYWTLFSQLNSHVHVLFLTSKVMHNCGSLLWVQGRLATWSFWYYCSTVLRRFLHIHLKLRQVAAKHINKDHCCVQVLLHTWFGSPSPQQLLQVLLEPKP